MISCVKYKIKSLTYNAVFVTLCVNLCKVKAPCVECLKSFKNGCGGKTRTYDLRVMSPTSCQLLHPAVYLVVVLFLYCFISITPNILFVNPLCDFFRLITYFLIYYIKNKEKYTIFT